jgi:hypothetical protein
MDSKKSFVASACINPTFGAALAVSGNYLTGSDSRTTVLGAVVTWIAVFLVERPKRIKTRDDSAARGEPEVE